MSGLENLPEIAPAAIGAAAGGSGAFGIAKILLNRMLSQYDKKHDDHATKIDLLTDKLAAATMQIAVLQTVLEDARTLRIQLESRIAGLRSEMETRNSVALDELSDLRSDVYVAHERLRLLSKGDTDFSKIVKPTKHRKR